jgi:hypothetical protein
MDPACTLLNRSKALEFARIIHNSENGSDISQMWKEKVRNRDAASLHCLPMNGLEIAFWGWLWLWLMILEW